MKNKLFAKKYYLCMMKMRRSNDILLFIICYVIDTSLQIFDFQLSTFNLKVAPIVQRIERKFPKL